MKTVLLLTDVNFWERSSGNRERIYSLVSYLAPRVALTVVNTGPAPRHMEKVLEILFNAEFHILETDKYLSSSGYGRRLKKWLSDRKFDVVIIEYIHSSYFLDYLVNDATIILDAHDIISDRTEEFRKFNYGGTLHELSAETESEILKIYDHIIAICDPDAQRMQALTGAKNILVCPHPMATVQPTIRQEVKNIVFIASVYLPNKDAINFFIANCWEGISRHYNVQLLIYGTVCGQVNSHGHGNIFLKGFVPDASEAYNEADIIINPVRFGAGLKIKNLEALARGLPLVTTSHGARGLEAARDHAFMTADTPEDFTTTVISLINDKELRIRLSSSAIKYVQSNFTADQCYAPLMNAISFA
jgi:glycosyltransferase involved in cell wall biosynthesis